jgi:hypothetical protein
MGGGASNWGIRSLADTFLNYFQPGLPVYLRKQNQVAQSGDASALGFMPAVSGAPTGIYDVQILPWPDVKEVSLHNIGIMGGRLQFGARIFLVSHTFVLTQMQLPENDFTDPLQVWRDPKVLGLYYDQKLFSMESITHEDVGGQISMWNLVCNANEFPTVSS